MAKATPAPSRPPSLCFYVCRAKSCTRRGAAEVAAALEETLAAQGVAAQVLRHDCFDLCKQAPNVLVALPGREQRLYTQVHPKRAARWAESLLEAVGDAPHDATEPRPKLRHHRATT
jgi:(2Fe-2S) ferredoxin